MKKLDVIKKVFIKLVNKKYLFAIVLFSFWLLLFDKDNIFEQIGTMRKLNKLNTEKEYYISKIKEDSIKLIELKTDKENLEKFARERYLMKRKNEDVFLIIDEKK